MNENTSFIGTIDQAVGIVPTQALLMMMSQQRADDYIFRATISGKYYLIW